MILSTVVYFICKMYTYNMNTEFLLELGLSSNESLVYSNLIEHGGVPASKLAKLCHLSRVVTYQTLEGLILHGFVEKRLPKNSKILWFYPTHPNKLAHLAQELSEKADLLKTNIEISLGDLIAQYNYHQDQPNIKFYQGIEGLEYLYADILKANSDILLFRSPFDDTFPEIGESVIRQIRNQVFQGIHTRVLAPEYPTPNYSELRERDIANLTERRSFPRKDFSLPAQIIVYGDKVSITSFGEHLNTNIIESREVTVTFRTLFEILWNIGKKL